MSLMMSGNDKAFCKLPMEMSSTTVTLKNSSSVLENDSILERLPLTAGEPSPLLWDLTVRSAVKIIQSLLSTMTEEFYSYKNGALVFTQKAPLLFIYLNL